MLQLAACVLRELSLLLKSSVISVPQGRSLAKGNALVLIAGLGWSPAVIVPSVFHVNLDSSATVPVSARLVLMGSLLPMLVR